MELKIKDNEAAITQEILKERLHYDKDTGVFTWFDNELNHGKVRGKKAGNINNMGYKVLGITIDNKYYKFTQHRLAWLYEYGEFPSDGLDHINHVKTDNRMVNLRIATQKENCRNRSMHSTNSTGHTGVTFDKFTGKYMAHVTVDYKFKNLGRFKNIEDAAKAAKEGREHYGFHVNHGQTND